jgi:putative transcription antitermination factor YqgF
MLAVLPARLRSRASHPIHESTTPIPPSILMRTLGLDYGSARCGCALADPTGTLVTPIEAILRPASPRGMDALAALVAEREVQRVVVGLPLSLSGQDTEQTLEVRKFAARLARRLSRGTAGKGVPVDLYDERFTTRMAQRMEGAASAEDSRAAAHMLEGWLEAWNRDTRTASSI